MFDLIELLKSPAIEEYTTTKRIVNLSTLVVLSLCINCMTLIYCIFSHCPKCCTRREEQPYKQPYKQPLFEEMNDNYAMQRQAC